MIIKAFFFFVTVTAATASLSSQPAKTLSALERYKKAISHSNTKKGCQQLNLLAKKEGFVLQDLARLRSAERCQKKPQWQNIINATKMTSLYPFIIRSWFDDDMKKGKYQSAYKTYSNHHKVLQLDKKEFENLALKALKTKISRKDKNKLRKDLRKKSPRFIPKPNKDEFIKVARDYRNARQFDKALKYYRKVINNSKMSYHQRWHAFKGARRTYKLERWSRMKKYIKSSQQWANFLRTKFRWSKEMTRMHHDANIEYIRTLWTEKGQSQAKKELTRLEKEIKGRYSLQIVYWLKGRMEEELKNYQSAVHWLNLAAKETKISNRDQQRVLWALAWNQRRIKQFKASQENLKKLLKSPDLTFFSKAKYLYWKAENIRSMGDKKEALEAFERLADFDLYGYYGALAYRNLGKAFPKPPRSSVDQKTLLSFFSKKDQTIFSALIFSHELEISKEFTLAKVKVNKRWSTQRWVAYLKLLQKAGAYKNSFIRYHTLSPKNQLAILEDYPDILFPQPYKSEVDDSSKMTKVSPALIYSIMKQESGFDVKARSHADAFGLLQLIPQVAKKAAQRMPSVAYKKPYDLYKPEVIIPLGANNLHHLFSKFNSNFILSVASYNANEKAVKGWIKSRFTGDPVTFIEDIPYEETKGYVKLVMRNYIAYNRFDSNEDRFIFPEVCLQGLQHFKK